LEKKMLIFLLLRRLSPRSRIVTGLVLVAAGLALVVISAAVAAGLLIHGVGLTVIGAVLYTSAVVSRRRARLAPGPGVGGELTAVGDGATFPVCPRHVSDLGPLAVAVLPGHLAE
jgi:drug/metabolite transporter (DMT)-like permease